MIFRGNAAVFMALLATFCLHPAAWAQTAKPKPPMQPKVVKDSEGGVIKIAVELSTHGHDISFDQTALQVPFGHTVEITYKNQAEADSEIIHNIAIIAPDASERVFAALQKADYELAAVKNMPEVIAISASLPPGGSDTIRFKPEKKGYYQYVCLMPGHGDVLGMTGTIKVE